MEKRNAQQTIGRSPACRRPIASGGAKIDDAILHASQLAVAVIEGRRAANLPLDVGQQGLQLMSQAAVQLVEARADIIAAHVAFRESQHEIGLRAVSFGDIYESPSKGSLGASTNRPRAYLGPWPIRDHRTLRQVALDEEAERRAAQSAETDVVKAA
jgi:hypothetical protein